MQNGNAKVKIFTSSISDGNMSYRFGARDEVDANRQRFFAKHSINPHKVVYMEQVHGGRVGVVKRPQVRKKTDGLITNKSGLWLAIYHADCLPLFIIHDSTPMSIGVAHVGWRGVVAGLPAKMVREMVKHFKVEPRNIKVKFGPFICARHYDVHVSDERTKLLPTVKLDSERLGIDLSKAVENQLFSVGISHYQLSIGKLDCIAEHSEKYWSYHSAREEIGGVMLSVIGLEHHYAGF